MICSNEKSMCAEQFAMRGVECQDIGPKYLKMKRGDIVTRVRGKLRAARWKDRRDVYILTNTYAPPVEGNFTQ
jgi:hypothetical protein